VAYGGRAGNSEMEPESDKSVHIEGSPHPCRRETCSTADARAGRSLPDGARPARTIHGPRSPLRSHARRNSLMTKPSFECPASWRAVRLERPSFVDVRLGRCPRFDLLSVPADLRDLGLGERGWDVPHWRSSNGFTASPSPVEKTARATPAIEGMRPNRGERQSVRRSRRPR